MARDNSPVEPGDTLDTGGPNPPECVDCYEAQPDDLIPVEQADKLVNEAIAAGNRKALLAAIIATILGYFIF